MPKPPRTIEAKKKLLIQKHFPWDSPGFPRQPTSPEPAVLERAVEQWLKQQTLPFGAAALALAARIHPILREVEAPLAPGRLLARVDCSSHVKSPASILEKMVRLWEPDGKDLRSPPLGFHNFRQDIHDLGRIRIVANFLSDAEIIRTALEEPYDASAAGRLTAAQKRLCADYSLKENHLVDSIHLDPGMREKGERCLKGLFRPQGPHAPLIVELQIQTLLQEAWDKKDHCLIYERRRRGDLVEPRHQREIFAMSELLYVADLTFDRLRGEIVEGGGGRPMRKSASRRLLRGA
jgi:ppGpp synthetase/RelA/SpoT-type nucleotidyltranferase